LEIPNSREQPFGVVTEHSELSVAWVAQQGADLTGDVTVVDAQSPLADRRPTTDRAHARLSFVELLVLF
jgi:hypothetical protein